MIKQEKALWVCLWMIPSGALPVAIEASEPDRIRPYAHSPRYWQYRGRPGLIVTRHRP